MCLIFWHVNNNPQKGEYRLILAANRDENMYRVAVPAFYCPDTGIIGGRDMDTGKEGGMWLGVSTKELKNKKIRFASLLNVFGEPRSSQMKPRGHIVYDYLKDEPRVEEYMTNLSKADTYNPFTLLCIEISEKESASYVASNSPSIVRSYSDTHTVGVGNTPLLNPMVKTIKGTERFEQIIKKNLTADDLVEELMKLLKCKHEYSPDDELAKRTGRYSQGLSAICVNINNEYGTRGHAVVLVDYDWKLYFHEEYLECPIVEEKGLVWHKNRVVSPLISKI